MVAHRGFAGSFGIGLETERSHVSLMEKSSLLGFSGIREYEGLTHIFPMVWMAESRETRSVKSHLRRIQNGAYWLALKAGESQIFAKNIALASIFHDAGMAWVGETGEVSHWFSSEFSIRDKLEPHTWMGADFLRNLPQSICGLAADIALNHHERWDGMGFPNSLRGAEIPLAARIVAVVHFFEENTHSDPRGLRMKHESSDVIEMISIAGGRYFDPELSILIANNSDEFVASMQPSDSFPWSTPPSASNWDLVSDQEYLVDFSSLLGSQPEPSLL